LGIVRPFKRRGLEIIWEAFNGNLPPGFGLKTFSSKDFLKFFSQGLGMRLV